MIYFDGVNIDSVAPVQIDDILISPITFQPVTRARAFQGGMSFIRPHDGTRTIIVTFAILCDDIFQRAAYLAALRTWAKTDKEYQLTIPSMPGRSLSCVCTAHPEPSTRQWWESKLRLVFTCFDNPYWTDINEKFVNCGTSFLVLGDAPPLMWITHTRNSAATDAVYSNGTESMTFSTIPSGDMRIDLNRQTAVVGSTSIMQYYSFTSRFIPPVTGVQTITGSGVIHFRERWK